MIIISLKYVLISSLLIVKSPSSLEPTRTTIVVVSWEHDLGHWGQYWSISVLLYQLLRDTYFHCWYQLTKIGKNQNRYFFKALTMYGCTL